MIRGLLLSIVLIGIPGGFSNWSAAIPDRPGAGGNPWIRHHGARGHRKAVRAILPPPRATQASGRIASIAPSIQATARSPRPT